MGPQTKSKKWKPPWKFLPKGLFKNGPHQEILNHNGGLSLKREENSLKGGFKKRRPKKERRV